LELKELNLNSTELTENSVNFLTHHLTPGITKLNLAGFEYINDEDILSLVSRCNQLTALDLQKTAITNDGLSMIITHLKTNLEKLDVR
jgi:hypothetical protein